MSSTVLGTGRKKQRYWKRESLYRVYITKKKHILDLKIGSGIREGGGGVGGVLLGETTVVASFPRT